MRAFLLALLSTTALFSQDKPLPKVERIIYRVTGLFSPAREKVLRDAFDDLTDFKLIGVDFAEAELIVEFSPAKLFPNQKPERVAELVNDKVRQATGHTLGVKPRRTVPRDKLAKVEIAVVGCDCPACCLAAYEAVAAVDGVYQATASFKDGKVTAMIDPAATDKDKLEAALIKKGVALPKAEKK